MTQLRPGERFMVVFVLYALSTARVIFRGLHPPFKIAVAGVIDITGLLATGMVIPEAVVSWSTLAKSPAIHTEDRGDI